MITFDANQLSITELNKALRELVGKDEKVEVINPNAKHHLGVAILGELDINFKGSVGYFCGGLCEDIRVNVTGSAGWCLGDNIMSGEIVVEKNVGSCLAPGMRGGTIVIRGDMGARAGQMMKGGNIIVGGNAGFMTGFMLIDGNFVILGNASDLLGHYMLGGSIFVGGEITSLGVDAEQVSLTDTDRVFLEEILQKYKLDAPPEFKKIVCGKKYHRYGKRVYER